MLVENIALPEIVKHTWHTIYSIKYASQDTQIFIPPPEKTNKLGLQFQRNILGV